MTAVEVDSLGKSFDGKPALQDVSFSVAPGAVVGLLGVNGAGKTTTVRILATLLQLDVGRARVNGFDVCSKPSGVRESIGFSGQHVALDAYLTGWETLELVGLLRGLPRRRRKLETRALLERFGLEESAGRQVRTYSGGLKRRLDLAACLIGSPPVLFLDEPTANLDPHGRRTLRDAIRSEVARGAAVLLTTQQLEEAEALADDLVVLHDGCVIAQGSTTTVKAETDVAVMLRITVAAAEVENAISALPDRAVSRRTAEDEECEVVMPLPASSDAVSAIACLAGAGVRVRSLHLDEPNLEEVFFALTRSSGGKSGDESV
jgi:ABC-type multidrug transport system ATPase subunit